MDKKSLRRHWPSWPFVGVLAALLFIFTAAFVYFGIYNIAADAPHTKPVYALLESLRDRSITVHARSIAVPKDLDVQKRVTAGGGLYGEMCAGCHLGPGVARSELSQGLYPQAPELAKHSHLGPAEQFWIIKHGVKLSAMPAWGKTQARRRFARASRGHGGRCVPSRAAARAPAGRARGCAARPVLRSS